jgi:hypothetical protein
MNRLYKKNKEALDEMAIADRIQALQNAYDQVEEGYREILNRITV